MSNTFAVFAYDIIARWLQFWRRYVCTLNVGNCFRRRGKCRTYWRAGNGFLSYFYATEQMLNILCRKTFDRKKSRDYLRQDLRNFPGTFMITIQWPCWQQRTSTANNAILYLHVPQKVQMVSYRKYRNLRMYIVDNLKL